MFYWEVVETIRYETKRLSPEQFWRPAFFTWRPHQNGHTTTIIIIIITATTDRSWYKLCSSVSKLVCFISDISTTLSCVKVLCLIEQTDTFVRPPFISMDVYRHESIPKILSSNNLNMIVHWNNYKIFTNETKLTFNTCINVLKTFILKKRSSTTPSCVDWLGNNSYFDSFITVSLVSAVYVFSFFLIKICFKLFHIKWFTLFNYFYLN